MLQPICFFDFLYQKVFTSLHILVTKKEKSLNLMYGKFYLRIGVKDSYLQ